MFDSVVAPEPLTKHPHESLVYQMEFVNLLDEGETLTGIEGTISVDEAGLTIDDPVLTDTAVAFRVSGGTAGMDYRITVEVNTSEANIRAAVGILYVRG